MFSLCFGCLWFWLFSVLVLRAGFGLIASVPGAEVIKLFSCSTQLSMKFKMLISIEIAKPMEFSG